jgi:ATP-dependent RNA helicase DDX1
LGTDRYGFGFGGTGKKSNNRQFDDYGEAFGKSDVIGCCLDLDNGEIKFLKNGTDLGRAFKISPQLLKETFYPAVVLKNAEILFNFGDEPFKHGPPAGFIAISKAPSPKVNPISYGKASNTQPMKIMKNAPQAIIMEVSISCVAD